MDKKSYFRELTCDRRATVVSQDKGRFTVETRDGVRFVLLGTAHWPEGQLACYGGELFFLTND